VATLGSAVILAAAAGYGATGRADGRILLIAIAGWSFLRAAVSVTWRDPAVVGPLGAAGLLAVAVGVGALVLLVGVLAAARRDADGAGDSAPAGSDRPDTELPARS
jgi:hypothetical protein